jgi:uncharacterized membrane protein
MITQSPAQPGKLEFAAIPRWLGQGWADFSNASLPSIAYAAIFCVIGAIALLVLLKAGLGLLFFVLAGGFMMTAPLLITGYFRVAQLLREGKEPRFDDILGAFRRAPGPVWVLGLAAAGMYLIWVTDALIIYSVYFDLKQPVVMSEFATNPGVRGNVAAFLFFAALLGSILAFIMYTVTVFAVPYAFDRGVGLVDAVVFSVKGVFGNLPVMLAWAAVLAAATFGTLLLAMPLIIVVFPILAYAGFAAYREALGEPPAG